MIVRTGLFAGALAAMLLVVGCADDAQNAQEPVAAEGQSPAVPDAPGGEAGTTADKAAGAGTAGEQASAEKTSEASAGAGAAMTTTAAVNVRKGAGTKNGVVRVLKAGETVQTQGCEKKWCKVGEGEYVSEKYLKAAQ